MHTLFITLIVAGGIAIAATVETAAQPFTPPAESRAAVAGINFSGGMPDPMAKVRFRFTAAHTHAGLPFAAGDEITIESHWAESIERLGTGHRITNTDSKE